MFRTKLPLGSVVSKSPPGSDLISQLRIEMSTVRMADCELRSAFISARAPAMPGWWCTGSDAKMASEQLTVSSD